MTPQDQIKAIAELDGWTTDTRDGRGWHWVKDGIDQTGISNPPPYLDSRDAIVPVIEKQSLAGLLGDRYNFGEQLMKTLGLGFTRNAADFDFFYVAERVAKATPSQLCEALLRATGKWKD